MKKHLFNLLLFTVLVIGLSGCRTSAPKLDYKKLARASVRLGVDIGMEDNHKLYLEAAEWIGTPYRGGGETKRGTDCSGMTCQIIKRYIKSNCNEAQTVRRKRAVKLPGEIFGKVIWYFSVAGNRAEKWHTWASISKTESLFMPAPARESLSAVSMNPITGLTGYREAEYANNLY